jgi:PilZ domain-containing protein/sporulation related protein
MPTADRRHAPRTQLDQLAYIHIEPDNGAIVLNASGNGLGFHAMAPVERNGPLRFSLKEQNRRIDLCGDLVWTDEVQKIGGVRFTTLTPEAQDQVLDWIRKSNGASVESYTLGAALLKALPGIDSPRFVKSLKPALTRWKSGMRVKLKVSGFARGLASGFLLSVIAFSVVVFSYGHRREFGESLIRLGERLSGGRESAAAAPRTTPAVEASVSLPVTPRAISTTETKPPLVLAKTPVKSDPPPTEKKAAAPAPAVTKQAALILPVETSTTLAKRGAVDPHVASVRSVKASGAAPVQPTPAPTTTTTRSHAPPLTQAAVMPPSIPKPNPVLASLHVQPVSPTSVALAPLSSRSDVQMFFEVGRFKKEEMAQDLSNKIAQLGVHATVVPKSHLWMSSYQVLAGPYDNQSAETQLREELVSHGYKPRPYERGSRDFTFRSLMTIEGSQLPLGDFTISWESYIADAKVKFKQGGYLVAEADGRWITRPKKFDNNEYVYLARPGGAQPLLEVHFAGMDRALVFRRLR